MKHIPSRLLLQRFNPDNGNYETVNDIAVTPYTPEGLEDCRAWLEEQSRQWHHNYAPFFGSKWRVVSPEEAIRSAVTSQWLRNQLKIVSGRPAPRHASHRKDF